MKSSPDAASWLSTGSRASSESMVASLDARITLTPTALEVLQRLQHRDQVLALLVDRVERAGQLLERGVDGRLLLVDRDASRLSDSMASTMSALFSSSWPMTVSTWRSTERAVPSRPSRALLSSLRDRLQLGDAATVEEQAQRAEHLLDLGVAAGALERYLVAARERVAAGARSGGAERDELLAEQAGLADLGDARCRAGRRRRASPARPRRCSRRGTRRSPARRVTSLTLTVDWGTRSSTSRK